MIIMSDKGRIEFFFTSRDSHIKDTPATLNKSQANNERQKLNVFNINSSIVMLLYLQMYLENSKTRQPSLLF